MIALLEAKRAGLLARKHWMSNCIAGIIVGVVALPLGMAFAIASGVSPEQGIYTAIVAGLAVSILGGSRVQIAGPTGAFIVILAAVVAQHGVEGLQIATLMAGGILLVLGFARMGAVIKFIPAPVIVGFTAGIGVIIWVGQWKDFFGLPAVTGQHFHEKFWQLIHAFPQMDLMTTFIAVVSLLIVIYAPRIPRMERVPGPLVALIVLTTAQAIFQFPSVSTIGTAFGEIPRGLPSFHLPDITLSRMVELIGPAFAIAMLGAIESLLSAVVADGMTNTRHHSNQELIGQGVANILSPLFGGIAATGAIARTATNVRNGGNSPIAGIVHVVVLVLVLVVLAPLAVNIPLATLAAILFMVAWNMSQPKLVVDILRGAPKADVVILLVTFGLTVFADLVVAVNIGVVLAMLHFLKRMADSVRVERQDAKTLKREFSLDGVTVPSHVAVLTVEGPFFFAAVDPFERALEQLDESVHTVIIRLHHVPFADGTALAALDKAISVYQKKEVRVMLSEVNPSIRRKLNRMGVTKKVGAHAIHDSIPSAMASIEHEEQVAAEDVVAETIKTSRA
ncbi:SulP family inorganic anion transporter [uncultured Paenalcaligenes sp.]|uniref:SulP family inorganic anion transporter n=1 Tax=uncultured Paenalcaligenes sp. TaxID=1588925 RepID=UPI00261FB60E|nr:SulP family inorganic anion transporter [uncultured Paenalcaligenes sp.]